MPDLTEQQKRQKAEDLIHELNPDALFMDGFDDAIIGIGQKFTDDPVVVYDEDDIFKVLFKWGMNYEEAQEYFSFNIKGSWVGPNTPIIVQPLCCL